MADKYFKITVGEDGVSMFTYDSEQELLKSINEELAQGLKESEIGFVSDLPDTMHDVWNMLGHHGNMLIIKGEIIVPQPKKVVEEYIL